MDALIWVIVIGPIAYFLGRADGARREREAWEHADHLKWCAAHDLPLTTHRMGSDERHSYLRGIGKA